MIFFGKEITSAFKKANNRVKPITESLHTGDTSLKERSNPQKFRSTPEQKAK